MYLSIYLPIYLSLCLSVYLPVCLQAWKRSYSARRPQVLNLTTSKMEQLCETSSMFELDNVKNEAVLRDFFIFKLDNIKNEAILRDFLQKWKVACSADGLVLMRFAIFPVHLSKLLRLPRKVMPGHTKCCTCHAKSFQQTWRSEAPKCNPSQEISARTS